MIQYKELLIKRITNFKKRKLNNNKTHKIISEIPNDFLISVLFGRVLNIASNNEIFNKSTELVNIFIDLGNEIINKYLSNLYKKSPTKEKTLSIWK